MAHRKTKLCPRCNEVKSSDFFGKTSYVTNQGKRSIRLVRFCVECTRLVRMENYWRNHAEETKRHRDYHANNRDFLNEKAKVYRTVNAEKVRIARVACEHARRSTGYEPKRKDVAEMIQYVFESYRIGDKYLDPYDGKLIDFPTLDHIVALSRDGTNHIDNLTVTSLSNNISKHNKPLLIWMLHRAR